MDVEFQQVKSYFRQHPALCLTFILGYLSTLGMLFKIYFLKQFNVSALDFLVVADFLFAFLQGVPAFVFAFFADAVLIIIILSSTQIYAKGNTFSQRLKAHWLNVRYSEYFFSFMVSFLTVMAAGKISAKYFHESFIHCYQIETKSGVKKLDVIDSSSGYLFTLENQIINVIPKSQVISISTCKVK